MAAIAFDPMEHIKQLEASGMPRAEAEAVVRVYTAMFVHNFDALVTKDYLDTRFSEFESRVDLRLIETDSKIRDLASRMDLRFAEAEKRTDDKLNDLSSRMGLRFAEAEARTDLRFAELESKMDVRFARMNVIQGVILVALVIPVLQAVLTWVR
jgi:hypothetical protein